MDDRTTKSLSISLALALSLLVLSSIAYPSEGKMNNALAQRVQQAAAYYGYKGPLDPGMVHLIAEEGFSAGNYDDDVGIDTQGVGQTAENIGENFFTETYPKYVARAARRVKGFSNMPEDLQNAVLSAVYRGDLGPKTAKLLEKGEFKAAAKEYLNHKGYKERKKKNPDDGVVKRMERNRDTILKYAGDK
jgi:GH24 family phage-related lysozyme (muramidase)